MKENEITIQINKPVNKVFAFLITPPNSTKWIPGVVSETTNEQPVKIGTIYHLKTEESEFSVTVTAYRENELIEWISEDHNYHCRYTFKKLFENETEFEYLEWVDKGEIENPFTKEILVKLKLVLEH